MSSHAMKKMPLLNNGNKDNNFEPDNSAAASVTVSTGEQEVVTCNGNDCMLTFHECNLPCFDISGKFYCPSCSYKQALTEYEQLQNQLMVAKNRARLARRNLTLFINAGIIESGNSSKEAVVDKSGQGVSAENQEQVVDTERCTINKSLVGDKSWECERSSTVKERERVVVKESVVGVEAVAGKFSGGVGVVGTDKCTNTRSLVGGNIIWECGRHSSAKGDSVEQERIVIEKSVVGVEGVDDTFCEGVNVKVQEQEVGLVRVEKCTKNKSLLGDNSKECGKLSAVKGDNVEREEGVVSHGHNNVEDDYVNGNLVRRRRGGKEVDFQESKDMDVDLQEKVEAVEAPVAERDDNLYSGDQESVPLSQRFCQPRHQENNSEKGVSEMGEDIRENEPHRHSEVNVGLETSKSHCKSTKSANPFMEFGYKRQKNVDMLHKSKLSSEINVGQAETAVNHNEDKIVSRKSVRCTRSTKYSSNPAIPDSRRKKLPWSHEEEEKLEEAVKIFSVKCRENLSWRNVLEYGCHVFHETRTPVDLKDKWRNMVKEGYTSEEGSTAKEK
ncbi:hypothetical protein IFM89_037464 [Coptis chinensis]|uniref:Myb-like domain-containing protein n=1 Tax=Coptis chinensis TaxID=261450 RepID=A0A835LY36_9MAGN|nr:hypothetical protein IFM89_037464 [Coptis chinensis]